MSLEATNAILRAEIAVLDRRIEDMETVIHKLTSSWITVATDLPKAHERISELEALLQYSINAYRKSLKDIEQFDEVNDEKI
jgi:K+/H+ antiporter YhaU regulatory subunit KhtT